MEVLLILPIMALVVATASALIIQVVKTSNTGAHMVAFRQVQTAGYWVSHDALQAQKVPDNNPATLPIDVDDPMTPDIEEILTLEWTDWDDGDVHEVVYSLIPMPSGDLKQLQRQEKVNDTATATTIVGRNIDDTETSCDWTSAQKDAFSFKVTVTVGSQAETRTYEIQPRPLS